jgi:hypothetical protein
LKLAGAGLAANDGTAALKAAAARVSTTVRRRSVVMVIRGGVEPNTGSGADAPERIAPTLAAADEYRTFPERHLFFSQRSFEECGMQRGRAT